MEKSESSKAPHTELEIEHIYGYRTTDCQQNL